MLSKNKSWIIVVDCNINMRERGTSTCLRKIRYGNFIIIIKFWMRFHDNNKNNINNIDNNTNKNIKIIF